ncbi:MAG TPA: nuclear transport factor 2 family protein [Myxococcales bacterium]
MRIFAIAALLSALAAGERAATPAAEVTALLNEFLGKVDDPAMHERFWSDDLVYVSAAGAVRSKAAILESMRAGDAPGSRGGKPDEPQATYSAEEVKVRPLAAGVAVLNFRLVQHLGDKTNHFRNSGTLVKRDGRWQVVSWQATREAEPPK